MKKLLLTSLLTLIISCSFAQTHQWYPKSATQEKCFSCGGRGYNSFTGYRCMSCNGRGYTSMTFASGANDGLATRLIIEGKYCLYKKQYRKAFESFWEVYQNMDKHSQGGHVCYWIGLCYELGFGVNCDRDVALSMYSYSMDQDFSLGRKEYYRVLQDGFYPATEEQRDMIIYNLKLQDREDNIRFNAMQGIYNDIIDLQQEQIDDMRYERENRTSFCPVCKGNGYYTNPNERWFSEGTYTCQNCGTTQSYSHHHSCKCRRCGGTGSVSR